VLSAEVARMRKLIKKLDVFWAPYFFGEGPEIFVGHL